MTARGVRVGRVVYLTGTPLPTPQAQGVHIVKMCEAFARLGGIVTLVYPQLAKLPTARPDMSLFEYYGVPPGFEAHSVGHTEVASFLKKRSPGWLRPVMASSHYLGWGVRAALEARRFGGGLYVTRNPEIAVWLILLGLPTLLDLHEPLGARRKWLLAPLKRSRRLVAISTLTSYTKAWLRQHGVPGDKIAILPCSVDVSAYRDLPNPAQCRKRLGLPISRPIVGYVGRFEAVGREKGLPELIRAMSLLGAAGHGAPLLLCVGGPMEAVPRYLQVTAQVGLVRDNFQFVDRVPTSEVPLWIRACDVVTIPWTWSEYSAYSTSPLKLFEYMAAERAIVASDLPSLREIVSHGRTAWLVKPGDPAALAEGIAHLLGAPERAAELGQRASQTVRAYTWERRAAAMWQLTQTPISSPPHGA